MDPSVYSAITRMAEEQGIDPAFALAVAERESSFNPYAY
jgi:soluble lytic murein transglycosylase-like protein